MVDLDAIRALLDATAGHTVLDLGDEPYDHRCGTEVGDVL